MNYMKLDTNRKSKIYTCLNALISGTTSSKNILAFVSLILEEDTTTFYLLLRRVKPLDKVEIGLHCCSSEDASAYTQVH